MKTKLNSNQHNRLLGAFALAIMLAVIFFHTQNVCAGPRGPLPPIPERAALFHESFDEYFFLGETNSMLSLPGFGFLDESWSGYALSRPGESVVPFIIPALDSTGHTNVTSDLGGSFRFWVRPYWSSQSQTNGTGPGTNAALLEFQAVGGGNTVFVWSLATSPDGNTLSLVTETSGGLQTAIQSPIAWTEGESHCLALDYSPQGTALFLDGTLLAQGIGLPSIPCSVGQLTIGSAYSGANPANGDIEEFYSFDHFQTGSDVAMYLQFTSREAALGPISPEEQAASGHRSGGFQMDSIHTPGNVYDPNNVTPCSPGGPFYITNVSATLLTNGTTTVSFDIFGGTNGVFYDIFATSSLNNSLASNEWLWIGQGLTCNSFTFTNQPADQAFYTLELPAETFTIPFDGDNDYGQLNIPFGVSNAIAIAGGGYFSLALRNNGTVLGWGDNYYGETNIPTGLSNVVGIAAGLYHGVAVLANGSVTNWGYYWDGDSYYASVTNRTYASAPPTSNVVAVAAGMGQDLALLSNGTVVAWGFTNVYGTGAAFGTLVPTNLNLTNVSAIACGWQFNLALSSNGTVTAWGYNDPLFGYPTNVPSDLTSNAVAIAAGAGNAVALRKNGTVEAWGDQYSGVTNVPAGLTNVVTVATGGAAGLALRSDGSVVAWGDDSLTNIPVGMIGVKAISTGFDHNMVIESGLLAPVIFTQPTDQYAPTNGTVTFSAAGAGVAGIQYQWQFNGVNLTGATNATLTLTNTQATNQGSYQVIISTDFGSITSSMATFTLVVAPVITSIAPTNAGTIWFNYDPALSISAYAADPSGYPLGYSWKLNGTNLAGAASPSYTIPTLAPTNEGTYAVTVTNVAGSTNAAWNMRLALPGMVEAWGDDDYGESDRPAGLTNVAGIAAGEYQSVAVTDGGTVVQWGQYWDGVDFYSVTNTNYVTLPPTSNVVAVAAGLTQALALMNDGTVRAWGLDGAYGTEVPSGLSNVTAIACGWQFNAALLANGTVISWGDDFFGQTNVPAGLSNVVAIATGAQHTLALLSNGTVRAWGDGDDGDTNIPTGLTNVVAIAAGESHNLALISTNGSVVAWGLNNYGQTNVPTGLSNVMALAAGDFHSVALKNDGTLVEWGDNSSGQTSVPAELPTTVITTSGGITPTFTTNIYPSIVVKLIAAGGDHTMAGCANFFL
jgi:alpha-tubulin suppressor-like RCC1 family protein